MTEEFKLKLLLFLYPIRKWFKRYRRRLRTWYYLHNLIPPGKGSVSLYIQGVISNITGQPPIGLKHGDDNYTYYQGKVTLSYPLQIANGKMVATKYGLGTISKLHYSSSGVTVRATVDLLTPNRKHRGYSKTFHIRDLSQFVVYHEPSAQFILLSPKDYSYILTQDQTIEYRLTNRQAATLSPDYKREHEHIHICQTKRGGATILKQLYKRGFKVIRA